MKKNVVRKIAAFALGATACLALGAAFMLKPETKADAAADDEITAMNTLAGFTIEEKAAVRKDEPMGLRFTTKVSTATQAQIKEQLGDGEIVYGTLMLPADFLVGDELTHDTPSVVVAEVPSNKWKDATTYTAVLGGKDGASLGSSYYSRPIAARSYALNKDTGVVYYTENTAIRSIGYVAYKAVNDVEKPETDTDVQAIVTNAKTKREFVFNENISVYNSENSGVTVIGNGFDNQSANVFAFKVGGIIDETVTINYTTSDESVISVNNGVLKAVGEGVATVTGTVTVGSENYTCTKELSTFHYAPSSDYQILIPASAGEYETQAANKLRSIWQESTGIRLPIITESGNEETSGKYISIGDTILAKKVCVLSSITAGKELGETSSVVRYVDNTVFVRGMSERATLYGVQQLLKDTVGYEYFLTDTYTVDEKAEIIIGHIDYIPDIANEVIQQQTAEDGIIGAEHGTHGYTAFMVPVGADDHTGITHNSINVIKNTVTDNGVTDTSQYYSYSSLTYKDWYATTTNWAGTTIFHRDSNNYKLELCYTAHGNTSTTNGRPALVDAVATAMFNQMQRNEYKSYDRIGFSQADHSEWCECNSCKTEGNAADNLLHFILDVAASLKSKLQTVGDSRADTFKICTLFYLATSTLPTSNATYLDETTKAYMSHLEVWFAEIKADFNVSLDDTNSTYNANTALAQFNGWVNIAKPNGADMLWWGYYASTTCGFIPYDSIEALRGNYALAYNAGVDYMFNQSIGYNVNWMRLKQYLMSELRWNANPDPTTWDGWIESYMKGAFGQGSEAMYAYYTAWDAWADAHKADFYNNASGTSKSISKDLRTSGKMPLETLIGWLNSCNKALAALDANDPNYKIYYNNIILERLTPLYLIMYVHGGFKGSSFTSSKINEYVIPYGQDFLDGIAQWNVTYDGEGASLNNKMPEFKAAIENALSGITAVTVTERQNAISTTTSMTLNHANIASGESYTATVVGEAGNVTVTDVTANDGSATLTFDSLALGTSYVVTLRSDSKAITFTNAFAVSAVISDYAAFKTIVGKKIDSGYYLLTKDIEGDGKAISVRDTSYFNAILDGNGYTVSNLKIGANGMFYNMAGATVKNVTFEIVSAAAAVFAVEASDTTFENVTIKFATEETQPLAGTETNVVCNNVQSLVSLNYEETGKTFFLPIGETEVLIQDANLVKGDYTVTVGGESYTATAFKSGQIKVNVQALNVGETASVVCGNGEAAYGYNVMGITKFIKTFDELLSLGIHTTDTNGEGYGNDVYGYYVLANDIDGQGAFTTPGYNYGQSYFQGTLDGNGYTVKNFTAGQCGIFGGMMNATVKNINFDFASVYTKSAVAGWNYTALLANKATNVVFENVNARFLGYQAVDGDVATFFKGTLVGEISENVTYRNVTIDLSLCTDGFVASGGNVFGPAVSGLVCENVTIKVGLAENEVTFGYSDKVGTEISKPDGVTVETTDEDVATILQGDTRTVLAYYMDDVTKVGFEEGTLVQYLEGKVASGWGETIYSERAVIVADGTQDYISVEFYAANNFTGDSIFHIWYSSTACSVSKAGVASDANIQSQIVDRYGMKVASVVGGERYTFRVYAPGTEYLGIGVYGINTIYFANVSYGTGNLPTPITQNIVAGTPSRGSLNVYKDDVTALGFVKDTLVLENSNITSTWDDGVVIATDNTKNCLSVNFSLSNITSGQQFMIHDGSGFCARISDCVVWHDGGDTSYKEVEILDAEGNLATEWTANTVYTMKIYHEGVSSIRICAVSGTGFNVYYDNNITQSDDVYVAPVDPTPENAPTNASGTTLPRYTGDETAYGWEEDTYVFEATMASSWNDRVLFNVDSTKYDYMDVDFVITNDRNVWWFSAWVVNAGGMLDGSYTLNENSGFANHTPNTGANGGNTKIQVFDVNGNVLTGARTTGTKYTLRVYLKDENLTQVQFGQDNVTMLFANVSFGIVETITADSTNTSAVSVYDGDVTALGFAEGSRVYEYVGANSETDKAVFDVDSANYDYVDVQLVIASGDGYFFAFALNGGNYLNGGVSYVIDPSNIRLANGNTMDRAIQVFDANGNVATSLMSTNTLYTLRIYISGADQFKIAKTGSTIYLANVTFGNAAAIEEPDEVVKSAETDEVLPKYTGDQVSMGFGADDYVFEHASTGTWNDRVAIGNNSVDNYLVFNFASSNPSSLTIWLMKSGGMVGGASYILAPSGTVGINEGNTERTMYVVGDDGFITDTMQANKMYTLYVCISDIDGIYVGVEAGTTLYYANVHYTNGPEKLIKQAGTNMPLYNGDVTALGFAEGSFVQQMVTQDLTAGSSWWDTGTYPDNLHRQTLLAHIPADENQTMASVEFVVSKAITSGSVFHVWGNKDGQQENFGDVTISSYAEAKTANGFKAYICDANGNFVTSLQANTLYVLKLYMKGTSDFRVANISESGMTTYFSASSITYAPYSTVSLSNKTLIPTYTGDVTNLGFVAGTTVYEGVQDNRTSMWSAGTILGKTMEAQSVMLYKEADELYASVQFSLSKAFGATTSNAFAAWWFDAEGVNKGLAGYLTVAGASTAGATPPAGFRVEAYDLSGKVVTSFAANTVYEMRWYGVGATAFKVGCGEISGESITIYYANPTSGDDVVVTAGGTNKSAVGICSESVDGFAEGTRIYKYVGETTNDKISIKVDSTNYDYVDFQLIITEATSKYFFAFAMNGGSYLNGSSPYILSPENIRINSGATMDRVIQVFDKNGNEYKSTFALNTLYTVRVYIKAGNVTELQMRQTGMVAYIANVKHGNDATT